MRDTDISTLALRLNPGDDLRMRIEHAIVEHHLRAAYIITCVGSLRCAVIRLADETQHTLEGPFEITSLTGTLSPH